MRNAIFTGAAFSFTVATAYALCSVVFWLWPEAAASFMNSLFHGLDFRKLQTGLAIFSFAGFLYALVVLAAWAFGVGIFYAWISGQLARPVRHG